MTLRRSIARSADSLARSLTLLRVFVLASALILVAGAVLLGWLLAGALRDQALDDSRVALTQYTNGALSRHLVRGSRLVVSEGVPELLEGDLAARPDILSVKVWDRRGVLVWTSLAKERIGKRFPLTDHLRDVLETGTAEAELEALGDAEDLAESQLGLEHVLEVYAPVVASGGSVIGAYEIYADSSRLEASIAGRKRLIWATTGAVSWDSGSRSRC